MKVQVLFEKGSAKFVGLPKTDGKASFQSDAAVARHFSITDTLEEMVAASGVEWLHRLGVLEAKVIEVHTIQTSTGVTVNRDVYTKFVKDGSLISETGVFDVTTKPGQGANYTIKEIAKEFGYAFRDIRCNMLDCSDFDPLPIVDENGNVVLADNLSVKNVIRGEGKTVVVLDEFSKMRDEHREQLDAIVAQELAANPGLLVFKVN